MQAKLEAEVARLSSLLWSQSQLSPADADAGQGRSRSPLQKTTTDLILRAQTLTKSKFETETAALVQARGCRPPARPPVPVGRAVVDDAPSQLPPGACVRLASLSSAGDAHAALLKTALGQAREAEARWRLTAAQLKGELEFHVRPSLVNLSL